MARGHGSRARRRPEKHGHDHVRPCRPLSALGAAFVADPRAAGPDRRLHRVRAVAVRADGDADLPEGPGAARRHLARGGADARGRPPGAAPADRQHPDLVGQDGRGRRRLLPGCRGQRSRRHPDEREHHPRRRRRARPGDAARGDGRADPRHRPHPAQRTTLYADAPAARKAAAFAAAPLADPVNTPARRYERRQEHAAAD